MPFSFLLLAALSNLPRAGGHALSLPATTAPNVVVIVADDLGYGDVDWRVFRTGANGAGFQTPTPNLARLAREGVRFDRFYTSPVCTPTRMELLTGRYPIRWGMQRSIISPSDDKGLPRDEQILPERLGSAGYETVAIGKWHLGHQDRWARPLDAGFDRFWGNLTGSEDYYTKRRVQVDWHVDWLDYGVNSIPAPQRYHTRLVGDLAVQYVAGVSSQQPFFMYIPLLGAHGPNQSASTGWFQAPSTTVSSAGEPQPDGLVLKYMRLGYPLDEAVHLAQVQVVDETVGRVLDELEAKGILDNTIVWFFSDNGGDRAFGADNGQLRGGKGQVKEGGIRVPAVLRYPTGLSGRQPGEVIEEVVSVVDVYPTLLGMLRSAGVQVSLPTRVFDGDDLAAFLSGIASRDPMEEDHFAYIDRFEDDEDEAEYAMILRDPAGPHLWKCIWEGGPFQYDPAMPVIPPGISVQLFDLTTDPGESMDLFGDPAASSQQIALLQALSDHVALAQTPKNTTYLKTPPAWATYKPLNWATRGIGVAPNTALMSFDSGVPGAWSGVAELTFTPDAMGQLQLCLSDVRVSGYTPWGIPHAIQAMGLCSFDQRIYAVSEDGQEMYQLDENGFVGKMGIVQTIPTGAMITGGDMMNSPTDPELVVFDETSQALYSIELRDLVARKIPLVPRGTGPFRFGDLVFDASGQLFGYDETSDELVCIDLQLGIVNPVACPVSLGETGAMWVGVGGEFYVYKSDAVAEGPGSPTTPGIYRIDACGFEFIAGPNACPGLALTKAVDGAGVLSP